MSTKTQVEEKTKQQRVAPTRVAVPIRLFNEGDASDPFIPSEIHVLPTGEWDHPVYGEIKIDENTIAEFIQHFRDGVRKELPITAGHEAIEEPRAIGWFKELIDRGSAGLYARVEWTSEGEHLLRTKAFKYFSPEYFTVYDDPQSGQTYRNVLIGGALTNRPFFKELRDVAAFSEPTIINQFAEETMTIKDIVEKDLADLSDEEKDFLQEHSDELTDDQRKKFEEVLEDEGTDDGADDDADEDAADAGDDDAGGDGGDEDDEDEPDAVEASEKKGGKKIVMSEAEVNALRDAADKGKEAYEELQTTKIANSVDKMTFSESNKEGRILPKQKDAVQKFMEGLSQKQRDQFTNIVNNLPKPQLFSEIGDGGNDATDATKELDQKVSALRKENKEMKYSEAVRKVLKENPDLERRYNEERGF